MIIGVVLATTITMIFQANDNDNDYSNTTYSDWDCDNSTDNDDHIILFKHLIMKNI